MSDFRYRFYNRLVDLLCDAMVVSLLLIAVKAGVLPEPMSIAVIGYALRSLVHPSLSIGIFTRTWPSDQPAVPEIVSSVTTTKTISKPPGDATNHAVS